MRLGIDLNTTKRQKLTADLAQDAEMLITMGCGDECPYVRGLRCDDWPLPDPKGQRIESVGQTRDEIKRRVLQLLAREQLSGSSPSITTRLVGGAASVLRPVKIMRLQLECTVNLHLQLAGILPCLMNFDACRSALCVSLAE